MLEKFADFIKKRMVQPGERPVFWSLEQQKIMAEDEFDVEMTLKDSIVVKMDIASFGKKAEVIKRNYPDAKLLTFTEDSWQICGA